MTSGSKSREALGASRISCRYGLVRRKQRKRRFRLFDLEPFALLWEELRSRDTRLPKSGDAVETRCMRRTESTDGCPALSNARNRCGSADSRDARVYGTRKSVHMAERRTGGIPHSWLVICSPPRRSIWARSRRDEFVECRTAQGRSAVCCSGAAAHDGCYLTVRARG